MKNMRRRKIVSSVALNVVIAVLAMLWLVPVFWLVALHCLAPSGSSLRHSFRVLFLVIAEYFTAPQYTLPQGQNQGMGPVGFFIWFASGMKAVQARAAILSYSFFWLSVRVGSTPPIMASANSCVSTSTYSMPFSCISL